MDLKHYNPAMMEGAQVLTGSIGAETILPVDIATGAVGTAELADLAVTAGKIGTGAVGTAKLANFSVTSGKIGTGAVGTVKLADVSVTAGKIGTGAVGTAKLADNSVTAGKIGTGAVGTVSLADNSVTAGKIGTGAIGTVALANQAVTAGKIATGAVGTVALADNSVTAGKIGTGAVGTTELADGAVTAGKIVTGGVGTAQLADGAVTPAKVEEDLLRYVDVQLTNAQILNLATVPVTIVAAPGANKAIIVHKILLVADSSGGAYAEPSAPDDMVLEYADGVNITGDIDATGFLTTADVQVRTYGVLDTVVVPDVNAVVRLLNTGTDYTGGNAANTLSVRVWYSVVPTVAFT